MPAPIQIDVAYNSVHIEGTRVPRPIGMSVGDWVGFWEDVKKGSYNSGYNDGFYAGLEHYVGGLDGKSSDS